MDDLIAALNLVRPFMNDYQLKYPTHCAYEVLLLNVDTERISPSTDRQLEALGFDYLDEYDSYGSFRFGSA